METVLQRVDHMKIARSDFATEREEDVTTPLSAEEARQWRLDHPRECLGCVLGVQVAIGMVAALLMGIFGTRSTWGWSAAFGCLAVVVPTVFFLRRARRRAAWAGSALLNLLLSELVKIVLTVMLLLLAPRVVPDLSWLALLVGLIVTLQAYWVGLMWVSVRAARAARRLGQRALTAGRAGTERSVVYPVKDVHGC